MSQPLLPEQFRDLEPFAAAWALATERERNHQSWVRPPHELQAFHDAMQARLDEALLYLNQYTLEDMPGEAQRLLHMTLSLCEVTMAVQMRRNTGPGQYFPYARVRPVE